MQKGKFVEKCKTHGIPVYQAWHCSGFACKGKRSKIKLTWRQALPEDPGTGCVNMQSVRPNVTREHLRHWALQTRILAFLQSPGITVTPIYDSQHFRTKLQENYYRTLSLLCTVFSLSFLTLHWLYFSKRSVMAVCILISLPHWTIKIGVLSSIQRLAFRVYKCPPRATERKNTLDTMLS